jgi:hypothetical protein
MGVIFHVTHENVANDTRGRATDTGLQEFYENVAAIQLGTGEFIPYGDSALENIPEFHGQHEGKAILRIEPDALGRAGTLSLSLNVSERRKGDGVPEETSFLYDRKLTFNFVLQPLVDLPQFTSFDVVAPDPARSSSTWKFAATLPSQLDGLSVQVESSPTGEDGTWSALPGLATMTLSNGVYRLTAHDIPSGTQFFHAVANSPLATAPITSKPKGPYQVLPGFQPPFGPFYVYPWEVDSLPGIYANGTYSFVISGPDPVPGLRVHVQFARPDTKGNPPSPDSSAWQDLSGGADMNRAGSGTYTLDSNRILFGLPVFFRVVASAPGYDDMYSDVAGPFTERALVTQNQEFSSSTNVSLVQLLGDRLDLNTRVINCANVTVTTGNLPPTPPGALGFSAADCGQVTLSVGNGQTLQAGTVTLGNHAQLINEGTITGNVNLVGQEKSSLITPNGSNLITPNGSNAVDTGGSTTHDAATAAIVAQGGGNIVAQGGGNAVVKGAAQIVAQGGGTLCRKAAEILWPRAAGTPPGMEEDSSLIPAGM